MLDADDDGVLGAGGEDEGPLVLSRAQARAVDSAAERELGVPGIVLMENAAMALEEAAVEMLGRLGAGGGAAPALVVAVCGGGNNGGDGFALARRMHVRAGGALRVECAALIPEQQMRGDGRTNRVIAQRMGLVASAADAAWPALRDRALAAERVLVVDALLGTGLDRPLSGAYEAAAAWVNGVRRAHPRCLVLAVDIPTGLDADTGRAWSAETVRADVTLTLCAPKPGLLAAHAEAYVGELRVGGIGVPGWFVRRVAERPAG